MGKRTAYNREWRKRRTPEQMEKHRAYMRLYLKLWKQRPENHEKLKRYMDSGNLRHNFGINLAEFNQQLARQDGVCAICKKPPEINKRRFSVDHNHTTGALRGILCSWCNRTLLPTFEKYSNLFDPATQYLKGHKWG